MAPTAVQMGAMTASQRAVFDEIESGKRGSVAPPFMHLLHSPETTGRVQRLGVWVRFDNALPRRLSELATLVTARHWKAQYEWAVHERDAHDAGLEDHIIAAIKVRQRPESADAATLVVHDVSVALHAERDLPDALISHALEILGEKAFADLLCLLGYYGLMSMVLNVYRVPVPEGLTGLD